MGKNATKAEKAKRNLAYAQAHQKKVRPAGRPARPAFDRPEGALRPEGSAMASGGVRTLHQAVCTACGAETTVPFEPTPGKAVYCRTCFQAKQA